MNKYWGKIKNLKLLVQLENAPELLVQVRNQNDQKNFGVIGDSVLDQIKATEVEEDRQPYPLVALEVQIRTLKFRNMNTVETDIKTSVEN